MKIYKKKVIQLTKVEIEEIVERYFEDKEYVNPNRYDEYDIKFKWTDDNTLTANVSGELITDKKEEPWAFKLYEENAKKEDYEEEEKIEESHEGYYYGMDGQPTSEPKSGYAWRRFKKMGFCKEDDC